MAAGCHRATCETPFPHSQTVGPAMLQFSETTFVASMILLTLVYFVHLKRKMSISHLILAYVAGTLGLGSLFLPLSVAMYGINFFSDYYHPYFTRAAALFTVSFGTMLLVRHTAGVRYGQRTPIRIIFRIANRQTFRWVVFFFIVLGTLLFLRIYASLGTAPLLAPDPINAKFYLFSEHKLASTLAVHFLSFSNTLLLIYFLKTRRKDPLCILLFVISNVVLLTTMKRAPLLLPYLYFVVSWVLIGQKLKLKHVAIIGLILLGGVSLWYVGKPDFNLPNFLMVATSNLFVEIREMGRILLASDNQFDYAYGRTFLVGLFNVVPASLWELKNEFYIVRYVAGILGLDYELSGIPRIGMVGEAYLNFGVVGIVLVSMFFFMLVEVVNKYYATLHALPLSRGDKMALMMMIAVVVKDLLGFYVSGSSIFLFIYIKLFIVLFLLFFGGIRLYRIRWVPGSEGLQ